MRALGPPHVWIRRDGPGLSSVSSLSPPSTRDVPDPSSSRRLFPSPASIFDNLKMKAMVQSLRFLVFKIIDILMANHRDGQSTPEFPEI